MPYSARLSIPLRMAEVAFAAIVAGLVGDYLNAFSSVDSWPYSRFIYTEVVAGLSIILGVIWLMPFTGGFAPYTMDFGLFAAWLAAFVLLVAFIGPLSCSRIWRWSNITEKGMCERWKAVVAFSMLSAICWLFSGLLGVELTRSAHRDVNGARTNTVRRKWYSSHHV